MPDDLKPVAEPAGKRLSWWWLMCHWEHVVADLAQTYRVNEWTQETQDMPWPVFRSLVFSLFDDEQTRVRRLFNQ